MSIYYETRFTGKLSFINKYDDLSLKIKSFFKTLIEVDEKLRNNETLDLNKEYILKYNTIKDKYYGVINSWCPDVYRFSLHNDYVYASDNEGLLVKIIELEENVFGVDFCIGNKNNFDEMELFTLLLIEYMEDDFKLVYYNETTTKKLNVTKDSLDKYIKENTEDIECYGCIIFDSLVVEGNSALDTEDEEEHEKDWLREGLIYYIN